MAWANGRSCHAQLRLGRWVWRAVVWAGALAFPLAASAQSIAVGEPLPLPDNRTLDGKTLDLDAWFRDNLVAVLLYEPSDGQAQAWLQWLRPPHTAASGYRAIGVPVGPTANANDIPLLEGGSQWRPRLGPGTTPPVLIITRPPGRVALLEKRLGNPAMFAVGLHLEREDWDGAQELIARAASEAEDPLLHAAQAYAAMERGDAATARLEAEGLRTVGPTPAIRALGHALGAELARRAGDLDTAAALADRAGSVAEGKAASARIELARGNVKNALALARAAAATAPVAPWTDGNHQILAGHIEFLRGAPTAAQTFAESATRAAPASWRAWQLLGLVQAQAGTNAGRDLLDVAARLAPPGRYADVLAAAARAAEGGPEAAPPRVLIALLEGSVPATDWAGAGPIATLLLAQAMEQRGEGPAQALTCSATGRALGYAFGSVLTADKAVAAGNRSGARVVVVLTMQVAPQGTFLNTQLFDARHSALRGLDSVLWAPEAPLADACATLARRLSSRLESGAF